jgi:hypothetical protein
MQMIKMVSLSAIGFAAGYLVAPDPTTTTVKDYEIIEYHHAIETCAPDDIGLKRLTFKDVKDIIK